MGRISPTEFSSCFQGRAIVYKVNRSSLSRFHVLLSLSHPHTYFLVTTLVYAPPEQPHNLTLDAARNIPRQYLHGNPSEIHVNCGPFPHPPFNSLPQPSHPHPTAITPFAFSSFQQPHELQYHHSVAIRDIITRNGCDRRFPSGRTANKTNTNSFHFAINTRCESSLWCISCSW